MDSSIFGLLPNIVRLGVNIGDVWFMLKQGKEIQSPCMMNDEAVMCVGKLLPLPHIEITMLQ